MKDKEVRCSIYSEAREKTGMTPKEWGRLFNLGDAKNVTQLVWKKENGHRSVNMAEALAAQLLVQMDAEGYDIGKFEFDVDGKLLSMPRK